MFIDYKFFIFRYLLNFTTECIGGQIKAVRFLPCTVCEAKSTKGEDHQYKEWLRRTKQWLKNEQIKRKQTCV